MELIEAMAPLEAGYGELLAAAAEVLSDDGEVRALWVSGSVGRGTADAGSDLDLVVTVRDRAAYADAGRWDFLDPVITIPIPALPGCFALTTRDGLRLDVVVEEPADVATTPYRHRIPVFDRDGFRVPPPSREPAGPDVAAMDGVVTEFLRQAAIFPAAVVAREDWLLGQVAVQTHARLLYQLLVEANQPLPPMGVKQWSSRLTATQRELLAGLPQPRADRDEVVPAMVAVCDAIATHGRAALESAGGAWPAETEEAVAAYWRRHGLPWPTSETASWTAS